MNGAWDQRFVELARHIAAWSKDKSRKVGCVIVGSSREIRAIGYNGLPRGADDLQFARLDRPAKYLWTEHAERNAIFQAARSGIALQGCTMYVSWFPCMDCARAIVQSGIVRLVGVHPIEHDSKWEEQFMAARQLLSEAGVKVKLLEK
jgi:dCMP deaminase